MEIYAERATRNFSFLPFINKSVCPSRKWWLYHPKFALTNERRKLYSLAGRYFAGNDILWRDTYIVSHIQKLKWTRKCELRVIIIVIKNCLKSKLLEILKKYTIENINIFSANDKNVKIKKSIFLLELLLPVV